MLMGTPDGHHLHRLRPWSFDFRAARGHPPARPIRHVADSCASSGAQVLFLRGCSDPTAPPSAGEGRHQRLLGRDAEGAVMKPGTPRWPRQPGWWARPRVFPSEAQRRLAWERALANRDRLAAALVEIYPAALERVVAEFE
jgi:hypothetical protein